MWPLIKQNLKHIIRTRLLVVLLVFSFLVQYVGLRVLHFATIQFQGVVSRIEGNNAIFFALFFQLFTGAFIAVAYGIWMVPYAHQGARSPLTFTLPVSKWKFPLAYAVSMLGLLVLQHAVMFLGFGVNFGFETFKSADFPWAGVGMCLLLETIAFEVGMFAFALSSMTFGQIITFFLGAFVVFFLQIAGAILRLDFAKFGAGTVESSLHWARWVYAKLPPIGDLAIDLRRAFLKPHLGKEHLGLWLLWLVLLMAYFRFKLRFPSKVRAGEV